MIQRLESSGQLENTYIIFTSDNGYHIGQHRLAPGKSTGFEEDIRVPFFIRGPGVPEGRVDNTVTTHIDLAPTFFELAGIPLKGDFDGTPMRVAEESRGIVHEHVTVEYWGSAPVEGEFASVGEYASRGLIKTGLMICSITTWHETKHIQIHPHPRRGIQSLLLRLVQQRARAL